MNLDFQNLVAHPSIPDAILEEYSENLYHICFKPDQAGVIVTSPCLVEKAYLASAYPHVVETWKAKQAAENKEADNVQHNLVRFSCHFVNDIRNKVYTEHSQRGVDCDQHLQPGMRQHWGELRKCGTHPPNRPDMYLCKGCRVSHYALESQNFDRHLIMARGARVPVCRQCAKTVLTDTEGRDCLCDSSWSCFQCREAELERLAKARKGYNEGICGKCKGAGRLVEQFDFCLYCGGWRVYELLDEHMGHDDGDQEMGESQ